MWGASGVFGFTGEQFDSETGFTFLRARYLDPRLDRFLSMDSVQPNAPGTQGYNPYAYVANNPTTWVDPSGQFAGGAGTTAQILAHPWYMAALVAACVIGGTAALATPPTWVVGVFFAACMTGVTAVAAIVLVCALTPGCMEQAWEEAGEIQRRESESWQGIFEQLWEKLRDAAKDFPDILDEDDTDVKPFVDPDQKEQCWMLWEVCYEQRWETGVRRCEDYARYCEAQGYWPTGWCHPRQ